ncbi:30S ribosomal protein S20 [Deferribacterales bacterium Es71-Z0220]|jgi:small subunit ribosomal protein S20|uniref:30S ribosomal protein S20 n=1 Tax=Deferrivibrio essentukiensis TaxID=2880922 RepID=UPI001F61D79F|nr:30S ribosomal protein S20 [Deferrivibrio essentukiensis]MCB4204739.1 30S ribosomal protein S20 [Deferrivibrio essentukiensis]
MAHTLSAKKRIRQSEKKRLRNKAYKSKMRTLTKKFVAAVNNGELAVAEESFKTVSREILKISTKGVIHKNQAARRVSRLAKKLNSIKSA